MGWVGCGGVGSICMVVQRHGVGGVRWGGVYLHDGAKAMGWVGWGRVGSGGVRQGVSARWCKGAGWVVSACVRGANSTSSSV